MAASYTEKTQSDPIGPLSLRLPILRSLRLSSSTLGMTSWQSFTKRSSTWWDKLSSPPAVVFNRYTFEGDLVRRMMVFTDRAAAIAV